LLSHLKRRRCRPERGDALGDSFEGGPGCSPSAESGGPGKEVPPKESKDEPQEKRNGPLCGGMPKEKRGDLPRSYVERMCLPLVKDHLTPVRGSMPSKDMTWSSIPGVYPDEYFCFTLWSIGHGPNCSETWVVFHDTETNYQIRQCYRFCGCWKTSQTNLPAAIFAGIIERLEMISIPLIAEPQGAMCDGDTSGFIYNRGE
jgi:hypothetical protein